ncbi:ABC-2 type transport system ATP-binding protein [Methylohalomonas lacus]|uniref:ABC-2 type transport system ATP-binding protein n=1 Tax=Methylohalomonas lacus TaxID=398773 RepID=A0AAE3HIT2_9GAMM|nr:ABC transporter ATP-binding protein [Methylohalomonas lacus]MCS3903156.1 ABC-2 type transport system ATP-binding protein [Methylohalomonas lacus]
MKALQIQGLKKTYGSGLQALRGIDLDVEEGDFFALLGPNGAGKSTTIGIITSLVRKTAGRISVFGHDLDSDIAAAKACIGIVPQEINFSQFETCMEIVLNQAGYYGIPRRLAEQRAEKYLDQLGLWDKRHTRSRTLSGGLKRRLMIARALVHEPRLLILDEPTAGVDVELRRSMWSFLSGLNLNGTTIVLTTHYLEEAENLCKNIAIINHGVIIENTSMKKLLGKLNTETLILDLNSKLEYPPEFTDCQTRLIDPYCLEVEIKKTAGLNTLFKEIEQLGIQVHSMRNKSNRLEELFMSLVDNKKQAVA